MQSNIDLSFPDLKRTVELDCKQNPDTEKYYPLAYLRRKDDMKNNLKNVLKVQNAILPDKSEQ